MSNVQADMNVSTRLGQSGPLRTQFSDPVPPEVAGDAFDRQRVMVAFNQPAMEGVSAFVLGTGGLGQAVAVGLCRLGVKRMFLLDCKPYSASNLTRQILGGVADIGANKVDVAARNLGVHNMRTEVVPVHLDAVGEWAKVVEIAKQCDVLFNCIDFGGMFDYAVNSLSKELRIPYIAGSSYAYSLQVEFFTGKPGLKCWSCLTPVTSAFCASAGSGTDARTVADAKEWLEAQGATSTDTMSKPQLASYVEACLRARNAGRFVDAALEEVPLPPGGLPTADLPAFNTALKAAVLEALAPGAVSALPSIEFVPREESPPTRSVGSWVGVCVASGMLMVNAWVQGFTGELGDDFPNSSELTLRDFTSMTDRTYGGVGTSEADCEVCAAAAKLHGYTPPPPPPPPEPEAPPPPPPTLSTAEKVVPRGLGLMAVVATLCVMATAKA